MRESRLMLAAAMAAVSVACGGASPTPVPAATPAAAAAPAEKKPAPAEPAASAEPPSAAEHGGVPKDPNERAETPHGGAMVALADKSMHLEVVFDPSSGKLGVYLYGPDGHTPMKLKTGGEGLQASLTPDGAAPVQATLRPVADPAAGNTASDSSHFDATVARLKGVSKFNAVVRGLPEGSEVAFNFPM